MFDRNKTTHKQIIEPPEGGWESECFYVVLVSFNKNNPEHKALFYSGFLSGDGKPQGYHCLFSPNYDEIYKISSIYTMKVIQRLGRLLAHDLTDDDFLSTIEETP